MEEQLAGEAHKWLSTSMYQGIPAEAVLAGTDSNGDEIYAGRAEHNGDLLPAKVIPGKNRAYVSYDGQEIEKYQFEILCGDLYDWEPCANGSVPPNAIASGQTSDGEILFIGRGRYQGSMTPGKIHPSHGCLYIPYGGQEIRIDNYEALVLPQVWVECHDRNVPSHAVFAGEDSDGDIIYVGRAYHEGDLLPAKVIVNKGCAYVCHNGREYMKDSFEVLIGYGYSWVPDSNGSVPDNAIEAGQTEDGETLFIGRGNHCGSLTPGKLHPSHGCLYIPYGGQEVSLRNYEVLIASQY